MVKVKVKLSSPDDITRLNAIAAEMSYDIDAASGWYIADAKSLVGLFGMKLAAPIKLKLYTDLKTAQPFLQEIHDMIL